MKSVIERLQAQFKAAVSDTCRHNDKLLSAKATDAWLSKTAGRGVQQAVFDKVHASKSCDGSLDLKSVEERLQAQFKVAVGDTCHHNGELLSPKPADAWLPKAPGGGRQHAVVDKMKQPINGRGVRCVQQTMVDKAQQPVNRLGARLAPTNSVQQATGGGDRVMMNAAGRRRSTGKFA